MLVNRGIGTSGRGDLGNQVSGSRELLRVKVSCFDSSFGKSSVVLRRKRGVKGGVAVVDGLDSRTVEGEGGRVMNRRLTEVKRRKRNQRGWARVNATRKRLSFEISRSAAG